MEYLLAIVGFITWIILGVLTIKFFLWAMDDPQDILEIDNAMLFIMITLFPIFFIMGLMALAGSCIKFLLSFILRR